MSNSNTQRRRKKTGVRQRQRDRIFQKHFEIIHEFSTLPMGKICPLEKIPYLVIYRKRTFVFHGYRRAGYWNGEVTYKFHHKLVNTYSQWFEFDIYREMLRRSRLWMDSWAKKHSEYWRFTR